MPRDPLAAAQALARLNAVEARFLEVQEERRLAILEAVRTGIPLRDVAGAARYSHETVRRIVAADGESPSNSLATVIYLRDKPLRC